MYTDNMSEEKDLIKGIMDGDEKACEKILNTYKGGIFSYVIRLVKNYDDAEEITFEAFIKFFKNIQNFDINKSIKAYLFTIAHNLVIDFFRKNKIEYDYLDERHSAGEEIVEKYEREKKMKAIDETLKKLSPIDREIVLLFHKEDASYEEISSILNLPITTIKTRLHRARNKLRAYLKVKKKN